MRLAYWAIGCLVGSLAMGCADVGADGADDPSELGTAAQAMVILSGTANRVAPPTASLLSLFVAGNPYLAGISVRKGAGKSIYSPSGRAAAIYVSATVFSAITSEFPNNTTTAPVSVRCTPESDPVANCKVASFICDSTTYPVSVWGQTSTSDAPNPDVAALDAIDESDESEPGAGL